MACKKEPGGPGDKETHIKRQKDALPGSGIYFVGHHLSKEDKYFTEYTEGLSESEVLIPQGQTLHMPSPGKETESTSSVYLTLRLS